MNFINSNFSIFSFPFFYDPNYTQLYFNQLPFEPNLLIRTFSLPQIEAQNTGKSLKSISKQVLIEKLIQLHKQQNPHRKAHWTDQEDNLLQKLVQVQKLQWKQIPSFFTKRTQNMCYSRYRRMSMGTKDRNWSKQQEQHVVELIKRYGEKWKLLSYKMPKFTPKQIRDRYLNNLRPNISKENFTYEQDLKICEYVIRNGKNWRKIEQILEGRPQGAIKGRYYGRLQKVIENQQEQSFQ